jgi:hypothetical protein
MRFMLLLYGEPPAAEAVTPEVWQDVVKAHTEFTRALQEAGAYVDSAPLEPAENAKTVRLKRRERLVTDGPFAETREVLGGYYLIEAETLAEAVDWAKRLDSMADGSIEVRPVWHMAVDSPASRSS